MLQNYIKTAWKVLLRRPLYTFITLFGIIFTLTILIVTTSMIDHLVGDHYPEFNRSKSLYIQSIKLSDSTGNSSVATSLSPEFIKRYVSPISGPEAIGIVTVAELSNATIHGKDVEIQVKYTDSNFWRITNFAFMEGGPFTDQHIKSASQIAIITDELAHQYFGDGNAINKKITINGEICLVSGVVKAAPVTRPVSAADVYLPYSIDSPQSRESSLAGKYVALIQGNSEKELEDIKNRFNEQVSRVELPQVSDGFKVYNIDVKAQTFLESLTHNIPLLGNSSSSTLLLIIILMGLAFMGLPAINLINLNSGRIIERSSEIGVRKAFGAPITALIWQFTIENVFISCFGGMIALVFSISILFVINLSGWIPDAVLTINFTVFTISLFASIVFGLLSGVLPAIRMAKIPIAEALHQ